MNAAMMQLGRHERGIHVVGSCHQIDIRSRGSPPWHCGTTGIAPGGPALSRSKQDDRTTLLMML
jgi:hypothetical protein